ncbi:MAG: CPBP family intramembrane metalloprotease [Planctomycetia bacterium]|nr:CPBP family intramembrane metalloprotease [Planctomycetia bacterium]
MSAEPTNSTRRDLLAVLFALTFPTLLTIVYFILLADRHSTLQLGAYAVGKAIQFLFPVVWVFWIQRGRPAWKRPLARDLAAGIGVGLVLLIAALFLYHLWLKPAGLFDAPAVAVRAKAGGLGIGSVPVFVATAIFYCAVHSLAEEYFWRWFVFAQIRRLTSFPAAAAVSALGFMAHHVFVLEVYFGWNSPLTWLFSLAVAAGGVIWAWMYEKTGSLYGIWASHALVDAAIFIIGYDLLTAGI